MSRPGTQNIFRVCLTTNSRRHESHNLRYKVCIMIACTCCGAATYTVYRGIAYSCTRKVAAVLLDAMLLDLSRLGHNGLVHNAREDSWQLN